MKIRTLPIALAITAALALAGCGATEARETSPTPAASADFPVTVDAANGEVTLDERPERIVSLSASATESLFAIGAGDQVVAVDKYSTWPEDAPMTELSAYDPNVEAIAAHQPDLVVIAGDTNGIVGALEELDIPVIVSEAPASVEAGYDTLAGLGLATGHVDETAKVIADMRADIKKSLDSVDATGLRIYHELDEKLFAASSHSFIGSIYSSVGATNVADEGDPQKGGYPQLTAEAVIDADPQLIVITDKVSYTIKDLTERPGWEHVSAVRNNDVVTVDGDIASRWGPRLPQLIAMLAEAINSVKTPAA